MDRNSPPQEIAKAPTLERCIGVGVVLGLPEEPEIPYRGVHQNVPSSRKHGYRIGTRTDKELGNAVGKLSFKLLVSPNSLMYHVCGFGSIMQC